MSSESYVQDEIVVLSPPEAVRHRPQMYLGDLSAPDLLTRLVSEMLCVPAKLASPETPVNVRISLVEGEWVSVEDDSVGLCDHPMHDHRSWLEVIMTEIYACRDQPVGHRSSDLCKVGIVVVNAMARLMRLEVKREGYGTRVLVFVEGRMQHDLTFPADHPIAIGTSSPTGNRLTFRPDPELLPEARFDPIQLRELAERASASMPGLNVTFQEVRFADR